MFTKEHVDPDQAADMVSSKINYWMRENAPVKMISAETKLERYPDDGEWAKRSWGAKRTVHSHTVTIIFEWLLPEKPAE